jgi:hypothetical protein
MPCEKVRVPIIHPSDVGANNVLPSILSFLEKRFINLGNKYLLERTPKTIERPIRAKKIAIVPSEKPWKAASPSMKSVSISIFGRHNSHL